MSPALPSPNTPEVSDFLRMWNLQNPVFIDYTDMGYEPNFCHVSAKDMVVKNQGQRVHGWALWQFYDVIVGDFHSVWKSAEGHLIDVTPPKNGMKILFVPDQNLVITKHGDLQYLYHNRTNVPEAPRLWSGSPTEEDQFAIPDNNQSLVDYCAKLGWTDTSMV